MSNTTKFTGFISVFVLILIYGHESWAVTERVLYQAQAVHMGFLQIVHEVTLCDEVHSCEIHKTLNIEPLVLRIERSQLTWFGHGSRMPQERLVRQVLLATPVGKRPRDCSWKCCIYTFGLTARSCLGVELAELSEIAVETEVFIS